MVWGWVPCDYWLRGRLCESEGVRECQCEGGDVRGRLCESCEGVRVDYCDDGEMEN